MERFRNTEYFVTENGDVFRYNKKRKVKVTKQGYLRCSLSINGKQHTYLIHRMVGECYLSNRNNFPVIDHIDSNKSNNHFSNLEWVTHSENLLRSYKKGRKVNNQYTKK
jgi:hypothetical protein